MDLLRLVADYSEDSIWTYIATKNDGLAENSRL